MPGKFAKGMLFDCAAFTLIEILTVAAILPMILVLLYAALEGTLDVANTTEEVNTNSQTVRSLRRMFDQDLLACTLPKAKKTKTESTNTTIYSRFLAQKNADTGRYTLSFITLRPSRSTRPQLCLNEVSYELRRNSKNRKYYKLVRREQQLYDDIPTSGGEYAEIYDKVLSMEFSFFDGREWVEKWDSKKTKSLPCAVKVKIEIELPRGEQPESTIICSIIRIPISRIKVSPKQESK